ncbi:ribose-5-phosphate isomerase A [Dyadobacter beijingensis]|uniref:Ribose-5-phosphate isomerase A n=1 Tax=Dyadobacter beijingensis TaxID=365489 RepID=A0ABQ2IC06_9BACT|nr:ribose-5-phosphate isomerase RpiA [Dyadobacter beijingensis]GGN04123.1 ribose-5-phosphate isomerase A [Dyadobacter beijingensis]
MKDLKHEKTLAAKEAVKYLSDGQIVGLGSGSSAYIAIAEIGELVKNGLNIKGVPTSEKTRELAESLNIPLLKIEDVDSIDITIDGADEFTEDLQLIKGGGSFLLKEKVVASLSKAEIIITDSTKKVGLLGKFTVPIEVVPYAQNYVLAQIQKLNGIGRIRLVEGKPLVTEQGNMLIDGDFGLIEDPRELARQLIRIVGVVEHGLFIDIATTVIMGVDDGFEIYN